MLLTCGTAAPNSVEKSVRSQLWPYLSKRAECWTSGSQNLVHP